MKKKSTIDAASINKLHRKEGLSEKEMQLLVELIEVLKRNGVSSDDFSIGEYAEECMCLTHENEQWIVFIGERGNRFDVSSCKTLYEACMTMIKRLASCETQRKKMMLQFCISAQKTKRSGVIRKPITISSKPFSGQRALYEEDRGIEDVLVASKGKPSTGDSTTLQKEKVF